LATEFTVLGERLATTSAVLRETLATKYTVLKKCSSTTLAGLQEAYNKNNFLGELRTQLPILHQDSKNLREVLA
jgi:hypothetical protein